MPIEIQQQQLASGGTNAEGKIEVRKFFFHSGDHVLTNVVLQIELFVIVALFSGAVSSDGRDVEHAAAKLEERSALYRNIQLGYVLQDPVYDPLHVVLSDELGDSLDFQELSVFVGDEAVLAEVIGEGLDDAVSELFFLLDEVGSTYDANGYLSG